MQIDYEKDLKIKWNSIDEYKDEEQFLSDMIGYYFEQKQELDGLKKETENANTDIKYLMNRLNKKEFQTDLGLVAKINVQKRESFIDEKLIAKLKELKVTTPIKTIEIVDMDELENVIYNGDLDASKLTDCKQVKEVITLKVSKKKGE